MSTDFARALFSLVDYDKQCKENLSECNFTSTRRGGEFESTRHS